MIILTSSMKEWAKSKKDPASNGDVVASGWQYAEVATDHECSLEKVTKVS